MEDGGILKEGLYVLPAKNEIIHSQGIKFTQGNESEIALRFFKR
jgi:hypothetical protein